MVGPSCKLFVSLCENGDLFKDCYPFKLFWFVSLSFLGKGGMARWKVREPVCMYVCVYIAVFWLFLFCDWSVFPLAVCPSINPRGMSRCRSFLLLMQVAAVRVFLSSRSVLTYAPFQPCLCWSFMSQLSWPARWNISAMPCARTRGSRFLFWALKGVTYSP